MKYIALTLLIFIPLSHGSTKFKLSRSVNCKPTKQIDITTTLTERKTMFDSFNPERMAKIGGCSRYLDNKEQDFFHPGYVYVGALLGEMTSIAYSCITGDYILEQGPVLSGIGAMSSIILGKLGLNLKKSLKAKKGIEDSMESLNPVERYVLQQIKRNIYPHKINVQMRSYAKEIPYEVALKSFMNLFRDLNLKKMLENREEMVTPFDFKPLASFLNQEIVITIPSKFKQFGMNDKSSTYYISDIISQSFTNDVTAIIGRLKSIDYDKKTIEVQSFSDPNVVETHKIEEDQFWLVHKILPEKLNESEMMIHYPWKYTSAPDMKGLEVEVSYHDFSSRYADDMTEEEFNLMIEKQSRHHTARGTIESFEFSSADDEKTKNLTLIIKTNGNDTMQFHTKQQVFTMRLFNLDPGKKGELVANLNGAHGEDFLSLEDFRVLDLKDPGKIEKIQEIFFE